jgi:glycosyltransferase involved in cell wall biosynthesis
MRIAQVAPLAESVPPTRYGGTERVVSYLTEELVRQGHEVTLFASGDSRTEARLVPICPEAQRLSGCRDAVAGHILAIERVVQHADQFDIIHFHIGQMHFPLARRLRVPHVTTLHGRLDLAEVWALYEEFSDLPFVSISDAQRAPIRRAMWAGTVHHGLPPTLLGYRDGAGTYLAFLGRISPEKRADRAIEIAVRCGLPLRIAAKVDPADREYFERDIRPLLDHPLVELIGEIGDDRKSDFLGGALALLFPIDWPEPFGLVMVEAMACGVPVIAFRGGSVSEVIEDGVTGFIVGSIEEAIDAVHRVTTLDRRACRRAFERRFTAERMARDYVRIYEQVIEHVARTDLVA